MGARGSTTGRRIRILREQLGPLRQILIRWVSKIRKLVPHVPRILSKSTEPRLSGYPRRENRRRVGIHTKIFHCFMTEKVLTDYRRFAWSAGILKELNVNLRISSYSILPYLTGCTEEPEVEVIPCHRV